MTVQNDLRVIDLSIRNFRCFQEVHLAFHDRLNVIVADNGLGKTAILDAILILLGVFIEKLTQQSPMIRIEQSDVRLVRNDKGKMHSVSPTHLHTVSQIKGNEVAWGISRKTYRGKSARSRKEMETLEAVASKLRDRHDKTFFFLSTSASKLPIVAYYGSGRFSDQQYASIQRRYDSSHLKERMRGYIDYLCPLTSFNNFNNWYGRINEAIKSKPVTGNTRAENPAKLLTVVREAVAIVLKPTGWDLIDWDDEQKNVVVEHSAHGRLPLSQLSSGIRNMVAITADIAHRCALLNPQDDAAKSTPGVVIIDEVDLHLHPSWQQLVVPLLQDAFPAIQFILSTHSPQVLSTVQAESIRVITVKDNHAEIVIPTLQTQGVESASLLAQIMNVDPVPDVIESQWLSQYRSLIQEGEENNSEAVDLRVKLLAHFGANHPVILDCDRIIRFNQFKRNRQES